MATHRAAGIQVTYFGQQDVEVFLQSSNTKFAPGTIDPWKQTYVRQVPQVTDYIDIPCNQPVGLSRQLNLDIPRYGNWLKELALTMVYTVETTDNTYAVPICHLEPGYELFDYTSLKVQGREIDKKFGWWSQLWNNLTNSDTRRALWDAILSGSHDTSNDFPARGFPSGGRFYAYKKAFLPLDYFFSRDLLFMLPLCRIQDLVTAIVQFPATAPMTARSYRNPITGNVVGAVPLFTDIVSATVHAQYVVVPAPIMQRFMSADYAISIDIIQTTLPIPFVQNSSDVTVLDVPNIKEFRNTGSSLLWIVREPGRSIQTCVNIDRVVGTNDTAQINLQNDSMQCQSANIALADKNLFLEDKPGWYFTQVQRQVFQKAAYQYRQNNIVDPFTGVLFPQMNKYTGIGIYSWAKVENCYVQEGLIDSNLYPISPKITMPRLTPRADGTGEERRREIVFAFISKNIFKSEKDGRVGLVFM